MKTRKWYSVTIPYMNRGKKARVMVIGVNDLVLVTTTLGGTKYEKLRKVKQYARYLPDETLRKAVDEETKKVTAWLGENASAADFFSHGIKAGQTICGMPLGAYFNRALRSA